MKMTDVRDMSMDSLLALFDLVDRELDDRAAKVRKEQMTKRFLQKRDYPMGERLEIIMNGYEEMECFKRFVAIMFPKTYVPRSKVEIFSVKEEQFVDAKLIGLTGKHDLNCNEILYLLDKPVYKTFFTHSIRMYDSERNFFLFDKDEYTCV